MGEEREKKGKKEGAIKVKKPRADSIAETVLGAAIGRDQLHLVEP
jgi:hypothetical protein